MSLKKSDKTPHRANSARLCLIYRSKLSLQLSEENYMFLLASKLKARAVNADELHFAHGQPRLNLVGPSEVGGSEVEPNAAVAPGTYAPARSYEPRLSKDVGLVKRIKG